jgi:hypothetical protein
MPDPWPVMKFPAPTKTLPLTPAPRWPLLNSRFALAATVAFCLVGSMSLASIFSTDDLAGFGKGKDRNHIAHPINPFVEEIETPKGKMIVTVRDKGKSVQITVTKKPVESVDVDPAPDPED